MKLLELLLIMERGNFFDFFEVMQCSNKGKD